MKLSRLAPSSFVSDLRLHTWPNPIKWVLLASMVVLVLVTYTLLAGGIIVFLVMLARWITG